MTLTAATDINYPAASGVAVYSAAFAGCVGKLAHPAHRSAEIVAEISEHLARDEKPSKFINSISKEPEFNAFPLNMLLRLKETEQSPRHHPEGNVWNHTMMVLDVAAKYKRLSKNPEAFMWAALLHDIGKPDTTQLRKGKITAYGHDSAGAELARQFLSEFEPDEDFIKNVVSLVRWHMQILFVVNGLPYADIPAMKSDVDVRELAYLGLCDRLGRKGAVPDNERELTQQFLKKISSL